MIRFHIAVLFIFLSLGTIYAQDQFFQTGQVIDEEGRPLVYVNVLLLSSGDSTVVKGATIQNQNIFSEHPLFLTKKNNRTQQITIVDFTARNKN